MITALILVAIFIVVPAMILAFLCAEEPILLWIRNLRRTFCFILGGIAAILIVVLLVAAFLFKANIAQLTQILTTTLSIAAIALLYILVVMILAVLFRLIFGVFRYYGVAVIVCFVSLIGLGCLLSVIIEGPMTDLEPILGPFLDSLIESLMGVVRNIFNK